MSKKPPTNQRALRLPASWRLAVASHRALLGCFLSCFVSCVVGCGDHLPGQVLSLERDAAKPKELPIPVAVQAAATGSISSYYTATATLEVEKEAQVLARVTGIVLSLAVEEGDTVSRGSSLLLVDNDEYRLKVNQAAASTTNLKSRLARLKKIAANLVSIEEVETAENDLAMAEAAEGLARLNLSYTNVTAPFTGRVVKRLTDVGQNVTIGTPLFILADFDPLLARVHVPAKEFRKLRTEQKVELVLDSNRKRLRGIITLVSPTIDPSTGTIKVTVEVAEYPPETRPGDFAEVQIVTESHHGSTLVNKSAVITDKGDQIVYVATGDVGERRIVDVGFTDHAHAEILSGVQPGDRIVIKGQRSLKHGSALKVIEEDLPVTTSGAKENLSS